MKFSVLVRWIVSSLVAVTMVLWEFGTFIGVMRNAFWEVMVLMLSVFTGIPRNPSLFLAVKTINSLSNFGIRRVDSLWQLCKFYYKFSLDMILNIMFMIDTPTSQRLWIWNGTTTATGWSPPQETISWSCLIWGIYERKYKYSVVIKKKPVLFRGILYMKDCFAQGDLMAPLCFGMLGKSYFVVKLIFFAYV